MDVNLITQGQSENTGIGIDKLNGQSSGLNKKIILMMLSIFLVVFVMVTLLPTTEKNHEKLKNTTRDKMTVAEKKQLKKKSEKTHEILTPIPKIIKAPSNINKSKNTNNKNKKVKENRLAKKINSQQATSRGAKELGQGNMPALIGTIDMPFKTYLAYTQRIGGVLAVFDRQTNRVTGRIERNRFTANTKLAGYARRTRDITTDMPVRLKKEYLNKVIKARGKGVYRFLILLPEKREQQFVGTLSLLLEQKGVALRSANEVNYKYRINNGRVNLQVQKARVKGQIININVTGQI